MATLDRVIIIRLKNRTDRQEEHFLRNSRNKSSYSISNKNEKFEKSGITNVDVDLGPL